MALKNINPTKTVSWKKLQDHYEMMRDTEMKSLFQKDPARKNKFSLSFNEIELNYSKNRITEETLELLLQLANEVELSDAMNKYFNGDRINTTEDRSVLHTALRYQGNDQILSNGQDVMPEVRHTLEKIKKFSNDVIQGSFKGYTGKKITDIVNIGIGGSDLGPRMVVDALAYYKNDLRTHFVSNIDGDHVSEILKNLDRETTLFVIVSKTFTTQETISNAETIKKWFLKKASEKDIRNNFVAVSTNLGKVKEFGIADENVFPMWNWVGGRYSLWSAVGLSISLAIGYDNFNAFLKGAFEMDEHFKKTPFEQNMPVLLALLSVWYNNFFETQSEVVIPFSQYLEKLPPFLQQLSMESNGKSVDRNGKKVDYQTGNIIWGNTGTNVQHAFMQLIHQGTKIIPVDFIGFEKPLHGLQDHHQKLMANYYAQAEALHSGKTSEEVHLDMKFSGDSANINKLLPFKVFEGNKPSNALLLKSLTPKNLGSLIALYEHKTFVQGVIWNIYSFDQFGVELGKELANKFLIN